MNISKLEFSRYLLLGAILLVILTIIIFYPGERSPNLVAGMSLSNPAAISPGQQAAINGASQLLLLQPQTTRKLYLPLIDN